MYSDLYKELDCVGKGTFGQAFKVISKLNGQVYLSKKIFLGLLTENERENAKNEVNLN